MENKIFVNEKGIIDVNMDQNQTVDAVSKTTEQFRELSGTLRDESQPVLVLVDLTKIDNIFDTNLRKTGFGLLKDLDFDKTAMISANSMVRYLIDILNKTIMKNSNLRIFETREAAESWLTKGAEA